MIMLKKLGCNKVALGHHKNDAVEHFYYLCSMKVELVAFFQKLI